MSPGGRWWRPRGNRPPLLAGLRSVLSVRDFRRLLSTRLVSQTGDGAFTAGIGAYVFFSATTFPNPGAAAAAFAVLYLPYSLIGPFAGVFIDRWSRRQILVWSALLRAGFVALTASLVASGSLGAPLYVSVLAVLGVNRFFLSSLSAALPHVVDEDKLVIANAVSPTAGTVVAFVGGLVGLGVHVATGSGRDGAAVTLLAAGACYVLAGLVGATMRRDLLGPPPLPEGSRRSGILTDLAMVARGLARGAVHVWRRRPVAAALGAIGGHRMLYGILLLMSILLYRHYFFATTKAGASLESFTLVLIASGIGYGAAAIITPLATRKLATSAWISAMLALGGVVTGVLGPTFRQGAFIVIGFALGVVAQGIAICVTTIAQEGVDDSYRGRVFALYDMLFNVPFVIGAVVAAQIIPVNGKSPALVVAVAAGYVAAAAAYAAVGRQASGAGPARSGAAPSADGDSPSAAAQRSNS